MSIVGIQIADFLNFLLVLRSVEYAELKFGKDQVNVSDTRRAHVEIVYCSLRPRISEVIPSPQIALHSRARLRSWWRPTSNVPDQAKIFSVLLDCLEPSYA